MTANERNYTITYLLKPDNEWCMDIDDLIGIINQLNALSTPGLGVKEGLEPMGFMPIIIEEEVTEMTWTASKFYNPA